MDRAWKNRARRIDRELDTAHAVYSGHWDPALGEAIALLAREGARMLAQKPLSRSHGGYIRRCSDERARRLLLDVGESGAHVPAHPPPRASGKGLDPAHARDDDPPLRSTTSPRGLDDDGLNALVAAADPEGALSGKVPPDEEVRQ